ncbi:uncharacterized protein LOC123260546 [Cotesia glomerata]|uniref:uncharacterized protein LOC123260546 n=1 Tax=Cotesia glomerata TaxID=32391 RepID=UPI001D01DDF7|nr:uncharacterized protein LOC123260546 [Cotesia glomerata]XP_044577637.1 uncharacterized protein LOC123260546 [Cotesia glomerata]
MTAVYLPVHLAVIQENQEMVELLIKYNTNLDVSSPMGLPIHLAIIRNNLNIVKILLKAGADLKTPLHLDSVSRLALSRGNIKVFDFLLDIGVDFKNDCYLDLIKAGFYPEAEEPKINHHFVKLKAADFFVAPKNLQFIKDESFNDFHNKCYAEVELMKNARIDGTSVSFYDVLHKSKQQLVADLQNVGENVGVTELELREKFPLYGGWICYRLEYEQKKNLGGNSDDQ